MNWRHIPLFIIATFATYILHEGAHWVAGELLGYDLWVNINSAGLARGEYRAEWHHQIVSAAGPVFTLIQAMIAFLLVRKYKTIYAFAFVFAALMMRFVAMLVSVNSPNDEARVSEWLGLGPWTLHILVVAILLGLTVKAGRDMKFGWRAYALAYVAVSIGLTLVVMGEAYIPKFNPYA